MSHTNSTTNYNLPQFVGTDKPTWLNDVNGAFSAIDTQMKANADSATTAGTNATTANNNIGTMANLETTAKTDLVSAVNEVNTNVGTVSGVASSASATATQANNKATALESALNMTQFQKVELSDMTKTHITAGYGYINYASNADGSIGKIYGMIATIYCNSSTNNGVLSFATPFRPTADITIDSAVLGIGSYGYGGGSGADLWIARFPLKIKTNGTVQITIDKNYYNRAYHIYLPPCLYFMKDFGDSPTPAQNA